MRFSKSRYFRQLECDFKIALLRQLECDFKIALLQTARMRFSKSRYFGNAISKSRYFGNVIFKIALLHAEQLNIGYAH
jgi:hypothetical protein